MSSRARWLSSSRRRLPTAADAASRTACAGRPGPANGRRPSHALACEGLGRDLHPHDRRRRRAIGTSWPIGGSRTSRWACMLPDTSHNTKPVRATVDSSFNGNDLYAYSRRGPADVLRLTCRRTRFRKPEARTGLALTLRGPYGWKEAMRNVYTHSEFSHAAPLDIQKITPAQWTIEASVNSARFRGKAQTFVGRDTCYTLRVSQRPAATGLPDQRRAALRHRLFRCGRPPAPGDCRRTARGSQPLVSRGRHERRPHLAAVRRCARRARLPAACRATELPSQGSTALGKGEDDAEWSVGRGHSGIHPGEVFHGLIDEVRVSDVALKPSDFLFTSKGQGMN